MQQQPHDPEAAQSSALLSSLAPDETLLEVLQRRDREQLHTGLPTIDRVMRLRPGLVLEISGSAGAGKSELLLQICAHCLLFGRGGGGGGGGHVVLLDLDAKFDMVRLVKVLTAHIGSFLSHQGGGTGLPGPTEQDRLLQGCLSRFHLLSCHSSYDVLGALLVATNLLSQQQCHAEAKMLLIDNVAAFYHQDRAASAATFQGKPLQQQHNQPQQHQQQQQQQQYQYPQQEYQHQQQPQQPFPQQTCASKATPQPQPQCPPATQPLTLQAVHAAMAALVRNACSRSRCSCVCSKCVAVWRTGPEEGGKLSSREVMCRDWQMLVTHRLQVLASPKPQLRCDHVATQLTVQWQAQGGVQDELPQQIMYIGNGRVEEM